MTSVITFLALAALTHGFAALLIKGADRRWVSTIMLIAWFSLFPLLAWVNLWFPFSESGDDEDYFGLAAIPFNSLADVFDLTKFIGLMEQPGYPWLLSILYQVTGHDLLAFKLLNLAFFVMLIPVWYRIGMEIESRSFGRAMAVAILLVTPLWFYWIILRKDIIITLLQSVFLLGAVQVSGRGGKVSWLLVLAATLALIPFRSQLVLVNVAVLAGGVTLTLVRPGLRGRTLATVIIAAMVIGGVLSIASNPERMAAVGIDTEHRVIGSEEAIESAVAISELSTIKKRALFPIMYLFSEVDGLNPQAWAEFDAGGLRGVLAIPWIFVGVPFFVFGFLWLMRHDDPQAIQRGGIIARLRSTRLVATPWGVVLMFILVYMAVSWTTGDTTRWRIPDMPAMAAVALAGWMSLAPQRRMSVLLLWVACSAASFALFHMIRGL